jgi:predicted nucleic acid-binding protein
MYVVADPTIFLAVALTNPEGEQVIRVTAGAGLFAPEIVFHEIGTSLLALANLGRLSPEQVKEAYAMTRLIPVKCIPVDFGHSFTLARRLDLQLHEASFLQCAVQVACPFLSFDDRLRNVARSLDISVEESIGSRFPDDPRGKSFGSGSFNQSPPVLGKSGVIFPGALPVCPPSPFGVKGIEASVTIDEIVTAISSGRR